MSIRETHHGVSAEGWGRPQAEQPRAGDGFQRPLRSRFQPRLTRSVRQQTLPEGKNQKHSPRRARTILRE
jgi:hypothetical protein